MFKNNSKIRNTSRQISEEAIRKRAYELWKAEGENSNAQDNWNKAKLQLEQEKTQALKALRKIPFQINQHVFKSYINYFSKLFRDFLNLRLEYKILIFTSVFAILNTLFTSILNDTGVIKEIAKKFKSKQVIITASQSKTFIVTKNSEQLFSWRNRKNNDFIVGDDYQNHHTEMFLSFSLESLKDDDVKIKDVEIKIPCEVVGDISNFGDLKFDEVISKETRYWESIKILIADNGVKQLCKFEKEIIYDNKAFKKLLRDSWNDSSIEFKLYFENKNVSNKKVDGIKIPKLPTLKVNYE